MAKNIPKTFKLAAAISSALDGSGAAITLPTTGISYTWEVLQTDGAAGAFGTITPDNADPTLAKTATFVAGAGPGKGYIKCTVTVWGLTLTGQSPELDVVGLPTTIAITVGNPVPA